MRLFIDREDEVARRNMFEVGTPAVLNDGSKEIRGEVVTDKYGAKAIAPYYTDGRAGTENYDIIPDTWFNVRKYNPSEKKYTKTHVNKQAMYKHIEKIIRRNGSYAINGKELIYWF